MNSISVPTSVTAVKVEPNEEWAWKITTLSILYGKLSLLWKKIKKIKITVSEKSYRFRQNKQ